MDKLTNATQNVGLPSFTPPSAVGIGTLETIVIRDHTLGSDDITITDTGDGVEVLGLKIKTKSGSNDGTVKITHSLTANPAATGHDAKDVCAATTASNTAWAEVSGAILNTTYTTKGSVTEPLWRVEGGRYLHLINTAGTSKVVDITVQLRRVEIK